MEIARDVAASARVPRNSSWSGDRRALAHHRYAAESAVFRFHDAQRAGRVSRLLLVLLFQRAYPAVPESAVSARLQHGPPPVLLAVPPAVAVSLERVPAGCRQAKLSSGGSSLAAALSVPVLGRISADVLHVFIHAGILFDAVLSGARAADRKRTDRQTRFILDSRGSYRVGCSRDAGAGGDRLYLVPSVESAGAGRYFAGLDATSRCLHAIARAHGRSDHGVVRLPANASLAGGPRVSGGRGF